MYLNPVNHESHLLLPSRLTDRFVANCNKLR